MIKKEKKENTVKKLSTAISLCCLALTVGCEKRSPQALLPEITTSGGCLRAPADACVIIAPADRFVMGEIARIEAVTDHVYFNNGILGSADECLGDLRPALRVGLNTNQGEVEFMIGYSEVSNWKPKPVLTADGSLDWSESEENRRLEVGQRIGAPLIEYGDGQLKMTMQTLFTIDDGMLHAQAGAGNCYDIAPTPIGACEALSARERGFESEEETEAYSAAAGCSHLQNVDSGLETECTVDRECSAGFSCENGTCVARE